METFTVTNSGLNYTINGVLNNPSISMMRGNTYRIVINAVGHPFWIQSVSGAYNTGVTNNGTDSGTITFEVPLDAPDTLYYVCGNHSMGTITITQKMACFKEDSKILCLVDDEEKYVPIQTIKVGDLVKTYIHGYKKVELIGTTTIHNSGNSERIKDKLYKYTQEKYPEITEELFVTGGHSILVDKLTKHQKEKTKKYWDIYHKTDDKYRLLSVVNNKAIPYEIENEFNLYHIALESDELSNYGIYANGLLVESCFKEFLKLTMKIKE